MPPEECTQKNALRWMAALRKYDNLSEKRMRERQRSTGKIWLFIR